jgi:hypothetical protein
MCISTPPYAFMVVVKCLSTRTTVPCLYLAVIYENVLLK